jgi:negative regulator of sigma E activity
MTRIRILLIIAAVTAIGIIVCPKPPSADGNYILRRVLKAENETAYNAVQEKMCVMYGKEIRSKNTQRHIAYWNNPELEKLILKNYKPLVEGKDRIAERDCWVVRLKPKAKQMPWKQIWVDKKTFIVLASRDWTAYNSIKRSMKTISISFGQKKSTVESTQSVKKLKVSKIARPKYMPVGFKLIDAASDTLTYSDGLYTINVCRSVPSNVKCRDNSAFSWGQGLIYSIVRNGDRVVVIGDLTDKEIKRIADSIP